MAWHVAKLSRAKEIPKLDALLSREASKPQTGAQQGLLIRMMAAAHGGRLTTKKTRGKGKKK